MTNKRTNVMVSAEDSKKIKKIQEWFEDEYNMNPSKVDVIRAAMKTFAEKNGFDLGEG